MKIQSINTINSQTHTKNQNKTNDSQTFGCKYCHEMIDLFKKQRPDLSNSAITKHVKIITNSNKKNGDGFQILHHRFLADKILLRLENSLEGVRKPAYFEHHVKAIVKRQNATIPSISELEETTNLPLVEQVLKERGITNTKTLLKAIDKELSS